MGSVVAVAIIGSAGLGLIRSSEGKRNYAYLDPVGIPTICYGHTGPEVKMGMHLSDADCEALLRKDIAYHQTVLLPGNRANCIGNIALNQNQLDALTSFTFNIGTTKFCKSTMARKLRIKDYRGAGAEFPKWVNATHNGKLVKLPGLIKRRSAEKSLFEDKTSRSSPEALSGRLRALTTL
jgi:lysozyme